MTRFADKLDPIENWEISYRSNEWIFFHRNDKRGALCFNTSGSCIATLLTPNGQPLKFGAFRTPRTAAAWANSQLERAVL